MLDEEEEAGDNAVSYTTISDCLIALNETQPHGTRHRTCTTFTEPVRAL